MRPMPDLQHPATPGGATATAEPAPWTARLRGSGDGTVGDSLVGPPLNQHPRAFRNVGAPREMHFFDGLWAGGLRAADIERYHALFARPAGTISGEWTPGYMLDAWTPALLRQAAPAARLLVLLRDPVERFRSGITLAEGHATVGSTARAATNAAFSRGLYAEQLSAPLAGVPTRAGPGAPVRALRGGGPRAAVAHVRPSSAWTGHPARPRPLHGTSTRAPGRRSS